MRNAPPRRPAVDVGDHVMRHVFRPLPPPLEAMLHKRAVAAFRGQDELVLA